MAKNLVRRLMTPTYEDGGARRMRRTPHFRGLSGPEHARLSWPGGRGYRDTPRAAGRAGRGAVARRRPRVRAADGARAAPVPDRAAAGRPRGARRAGPDGGLLHGAP